MERPDSLEFFKGTNRIAMYLRNAGRNSQDSPLYYSTLFFVPSQPYSLLVSTGRQAAIKLKLCRAKTN